MEAIKVIGGTNVQWAHDPVTDRDVIIEINSNPVNTSAALQEQLSKLRPGEKAVVTILREGKQHELIATL